MNIASTFKAVVLLGALAACSSSTNPGEPVQIAFACDNSLVTESPGGYAVVFLETASGWVSLEGHRGQDSWRTIPVQVARLGGEELRSLSDGSAAFAAEADGLITISPTTRNYDVRAQIITASGETRQFMVSAQVRASCGDRGWLPDP